MLERAAESPRSWFGCGFRVRSCLRSVPLWPLTVFKCLCKKFPIQKMLSIAEPIHVHVSLCILSACIYLVSKLPGEEVACAPRGGPALAAGRPPVGRGSPLRASSPSSDGLRGSHPGSSASVLLAPVTWEVVLSFAKMTNVLLIKAGDSRQVGRQPSSPRKVQSSPGPWRAGFRFGLGTEVGLSAW